jgi:putative lipoprotein
MMNCPIATRIRAARMGLVALAALSCTTAQRSPDRASPATPSDLSVIEGTAAYRERIALPPDATFEAVLLDVSRLDAPGAAIARTLLVNPPQVPINFSVSFDTALIDDRRNYAIRTRILSEGKTLWVSDRVYPVLTHGGGRRVDILMRRVGSADQRTGEDTVVVLAGEVTYAADVARVTECSSRRIFPVSQEGDFATLRKAYTALARVPGAPLYVTFEGAIASRRVRTGTGMTPTVIVQKFIDAWPYQTCATSRATRPLLGTPWRITMLDSTRVDAIGRREPQLLMTRDSTNLRYSATVGCNGVGGDLTVDGDRIAFGTGTGTMMSCGARLDSLERQLIQSLGDAARWRILGNTLRLTDTTGASVILLEARPGR